MDSGVQVFGEWVFCRFLKFIFGGKEGGSRVARMPTHAMRPHEWGTRLLPPLTDGGHGGAEEGFEVVGGFGVLGDGGFDGLLGDGAGIAEVDQG